MPAGFNKINFIVYVFIVYYKQFAWVAVTEILLILLLLTYYIIFRLIFPKKFFIALVSNRNVYWINNWKINISN